MCPPGSPAGRRTRVRERLVEPPTVQTTVAEERDIPVAGQRRGSQLSNRATEALLLRLRGSAEQAAELARGEVAAPGHEEALENQAVAAPAPAEPIPGAADATEQQADTEQQTSEIASTEEEPDEAPVIADAQPAITAESETAEATPVQPQAPTDTADLSQTGVGDADVPELDETAGVQNNLATQTTASADTAVGSGSDADADPASDPAVDPLALDAGTPSDDNSALTSGPELQAWHGRTVGAAESIETPALSRAPGAAATVRGRGSSMRGGRRRRREAIDEEASAAVSEPPQPVDPPPAPPPDPVPGANELVESTADVQLADARMPDLNISPRGTQPLVSDPAARRPPPEPAPVQQGSTNSPTGSTSATETAPTDSDVAATDAVTEAANAPLVELPPGSAEGVTIEDTPPPPREPLPPNVGNIMRDVIARLLVDTRTQAQPIITDARSEAYPNQVLPRVYNDIGDDKLDGLTETLTEALRLVAADAGVAADQLNAAVDTRRTELETIADAAAGELETTGTDEAELMCEASGDEVAQVDAAEDAQHARSTATVQAATGEGSPQVIDARRDSQLRKINRRVANIRFDYDRSKDRRHAALDRAMVLQSQAYDQTATADQEAIAAEGGGHQVGELARSMQRAVIRNWVSSEKRGLGIEVRRLKAVSTADIDSYRDATHEAGQTALAQVREWAITQKGETSSWWDNLWAMFTDWSQQAEVEAENWSVVRSGEARDATVQNMGVLASFIHTQGQDINLETNEAFNGLGEEQQAVITDYYASPADNRDTIGAVAAGLKFRLAAQQKVPLIEALKTEVMAKPDSDASNLEQIGIAQTSGFSAMRIADRLYDAMFGGVTGWGTDEDKIYDNLSGLTALQGRAVRAMYRQEHGSNLDSDLASELDADNALVRARAALDGDPVMETVGALNEAMSGMGTDEDTIMRMLRGKTDEQRAQIAEEYQRRYGVDLIRALDSEMDDHDQQRAEALLEGDTSRADAIALDQAMHGGFLGWGTDEAQIESVYGDIRNDVSGQQVPDGQGGMRPMTQAEMEAEVAQRNMQVEASYDDEYGSSADQDSALRAAYRSELSGPDLDLAVALADNDLVAADAARLERERRGFYADDDAINGVLENQYGRALEGLRRDPEWRERRNELQRQAQDEGWDPYQLADAERVLDREMEEAARQGGAANMAALEERYDSNYSRWGSGGLQVMIAFNMSGTDQERARSLREQGGYLSPAQRIDFATRGIGTDEAEFERAISGRTAAEIEQIDAELADMDPPRDTTRQLAASELSGRDEFDMNMRLQGVPQNAEQEMAQSRQRTEWELRNSPVQGHQRNVLQNRLNRMQRQYDLINDPDADPFERQRALDQFRARGTGIQSGVEGYRAQVDAVTDAVATAAALTAAITVTVLTGGVAGAVLGALAAAAATISVKTALKGAAYGVEDMAVDAVVGIVDAGVAYATFGMGNALLRLASSQGGRMARLGSTALATRLARMAGSSSRMQRMMAHGIAEMIEGAAGALPSALAGNMLNDKNWEQGNPFTNILGGTLVETGMGGLMGGAMGSFGGFRAPRVDPPTPRTGDILAHRGTPQDRLDAWRSFRTENPDANMGEFLRRYDDQVADRLAAETRDADVQRALRTELLAGVPPRQRGQFNDVTIEVMSDADFKAFTKSDSANAVTLIDGGQPRVIMRDGAPPGVLREEGIHLQQIADPDLGRLARRLDEGRLRDWDSLSLGEQLELYSIKVELEIDAQIKLIDGLEVDIRRGGPGVDIDALQSQRRRAQDSLTNLRRRADEVASLGPMDRIAMSRGLRDPPPYLDQPARLFNKADDVSSPKVGDAVEDSPLQTQAAKDGNSVHLQETPVLETSRFKLNDDANITLHKNGVETTLIVKDGQLHFAGPPSTAVRNNESFSGFEVRGADGTMEPFDFTYNSGRTIHVKRPYRRVELRRSTGPGANDFEVIEVRGEAFSLDHSTGQRLGWVKRGSENTSAGAAAELASQRKSARLVADSKSPVVAEFQVQHADGTGFDGIEVRLDAEGRPVMSIVEVKNYNRHVPYKDFTAVSTHPERGNLLANAEDLQRRFTPTEAEIDLAARNIAAQDARVRQELDDMESALGHGPFGPMPGDDGALDLDDLYDMVADGPAGFQTRALETQNAASARLRDEVDRIVAQRLGITPEQFRMARDAMDAGRLELLVRLTPTASIGRRNTNNLTDRLSKDWTDLRDNPMFRGVPDKLRSEGISADELRLAEAALSGADAIEGMSRQLGYIGMPGARFMDGAGNPLDVRVLTQAETTDAAAVAAQLHQRMSTAVQLPDGSHSPLNLVIDLSDATVSKPELEQEIREALIDLGMTSQQMERLAFVHHAT